jgi:hypothetical protein
MRGLAYLWWVPRQLAAGPGHPGFVTLGVAAGGAALVGLLALAGRPLKERPSARDAAMIAVLKATGYGSPSWSGSAMSRTTRGEAT